MAISKLIDRSFKGTEWRQNGWNQTKRDNTLNCTFVYRDTLIGGAKIVQYQQAGFWESLPPRQAIVLASREVLYDSGKDWWIWLLDMSDSERSAVDNKPTKTLVMLKFFYTNVGGHLNVTSFNGRGQVVSDRRLTLSIPTKTYKLLKARSMVREK